MSGDTAFKVFKLSAMGYCCTQIMLKMALEEEGEENEEIEEKEVMVNSK